MCGRFALTHSPETVSTTVGLDRLDAFPPRYNIAPTQPILVVLGGREARPEARGEGRQALLVRWGLIPGWAKDPSALPLLFNARSESAGERAAFRGALRHRRCLVPASGFYEWQRRGKDRSQPFYVRPQDGTPITFAGLMETYLAADGSEIDTATILTRAANDTLSAIHPRMPVIVRPADHERWLDCRNVEPADVADIFARTEPVPVTLVPVSERVNAVSNMTPDLQTPVGEGDAPAAGKSEQARFDF